MAFHILGTGVSSSLFNAYDPASPTQTTVYVPSQFGWNFPSVGLAVFSKTLLKTRSPSWNVRGFTCLLYRLTSLYWYDTIHTTIALRSSSSISRSLVPTSGAPFLPFPCRQLQPSWSRRRRISSRYSCRRRCCSNSYGCRRRDYPYCHSGKCCCGFLLCCSCLPSPWHYSPCPKEIPHSGWPHSTLSATS